MKRFRFLGIPYIVWLAILVVIPLIFMLILAFTETRGSDLSTATFSLQSFKYVFSSTYLTAYKNSLKIAIISTLLCFIIGYPVAYFVSKLKIKNKMGLMLLIILPMWSNMLLRIMAWETLFYPNSILNIFGISLELIGTDIAVIIVTVTMYLPFMILPIYTVLEKIDKSLIEASNDLGVSPFKTFWKVIFPMSSKGIVSGTIMVFLPAATGFAISKRIGGGAVSMIGNVIEEQFGRNNNFNLGSALSIVIVVVILAVVILMSKIDEDGETLL